jgi:hypothetical protein
VAQDRAENRGDYKAASCRELVHLVQKLYYFTECNLSDLKLRAYHQRKNNNNILSLKKNFKYIVQNKTISSIIFFFLYQLICNTGLETLDNII